jgi:kinesin family protein 18/19
MTYGTSGSGKTHTIFGNSTGDEEGLVYYACDEIFRLFRKKKISFEMSVCLLEIYNEQITNLLPFNNSKVDLLEDEFGEIILQRAERVEVQNAEELKQIVQAGAQSRHIAENFSNKRSSRSHMIVLLEMSFHYKGELRSTKVAFLDLAGSERMVLDKKQLMREGANINRSLLALTNCISILAERNSKKHVPYRDSKLTRILKDFMAHENIIKFLVCLKQERRFLEESLITLNYAYRAQKIEKTKNLVKFQVNSVRFFKHKINQLQKELRLLKMNKSRTQDDSVLSKSTKKSKKLGKSMKKKKKKKAKKVKKYEKPEKTFDLFNQFISGEWENTIFENYKKDRKIMHALKHIFSTTDLNQIISEQNSVNAGKEFLDFGLINL